MVPSPYVDLPPFLEFSEQPKIEGSNNVAEAEKSFWP